MRWDLVVPAGGPWKLSLQSLQDVVRLFTRLVLASLLDYTGAAGFTFTHDLLLKSQRGL
jgi:hypothetical protein